MSSQNNEELAVENWLITQNNNTKQLLKHPLLKKDVWQTIEDLGLEVTPHKKTLTISFKSIKQDWLKLLVKLYTLVRSQRQIATKTLSGNVQAFTKVSYFFYQQDILIPEQINEQVIEKFACYLQDVHLSNNTIFNYLKVLENFFYVCRQEGWLNINTRWFKGKYKNSTPKSNRIEYIPEEIWEQLDRNLYHLPEPIQRMVLLIRGTGLRIGELLNLPLDCLRKRNNQWRLRFLTEKYKSEDEIPICAELAAIIQEQQEYIRDHFGDSYYNLFGSNDGSHIYKPAPRVMTAVTFNNWLNKLSKKQKIQQKNGKIWHFKSHQFRRTVATIMTNAGVRDLIIQKYLRHRSPDMQDHYKHLLKQVLGEEYQELMKGSKYVDSTGKLVATHKPQNLITETVRRKMYQITTQYGECHRPVLKSHCQTVNACWRCEHWLTSTADLGYLKEDIQRLENEIEIANKLEMVRQAKELISDRQQLKIRIQGLEKVND